MIMRKSFNFVALVAHLSIILKSSSPTITLSFIAPQDVAARRIRLLSKRKSSHFQNAKTKTSFFPHPPQAAWTGFGAGDSKDFKGTFQDLKRTESANFGVEPRLYPIPSAVSLLITRVEYDATWDNESLAITDQIKKPFINGGFGRVCLHPRRFLKVFFDKKFVDVAPPRGDANSAIGVFRIIQDFREGNAIAAGTLEFTVEDFKVSKVKPLDSLHFSARSFRNKIAITPLFDCDGNRDRNAKASIFRVKGLSRQIISAHMPDAVPEDVLRKNAHRRRQSFELRVYGDGGELDSVTRVGSKLMPGEVWDERHPDWYDYRTFGKNGKGEPFMLLEMKDDLIALVPEVGTGGGAEASKDGSGNFSNVSDDAVSGGSGALDCLTGNCSIM